MLVYVFTTASPSPSSVGEDFTQRDQYEDLGVPETGNSFNMPGPNVAGKHNVVACFLY